MKTAFETHVEIGGQVLFAQNIEHHQSAVACTSHQFPIRERHCGRIRLHGARHDIRITPGRIDFSNPLDRGTHSHDLGRAIRTQRDSFDSRARRLPARSLG